MLHPQFCYLNFLTGLFSYANPANGAECVKSEKGEILCTKCHFVVCVVFEAHKLVAVLMNAVLRVEMSLFQSK